MDILYLSHRFPYPPQNGGKIRSFNMIRHLHEQGHRVTVCSPVRSETEARQGAGMAAFCTAYETALVNDTVQTMRMVGNLALTTPSSMGFFHSSRLRRRVRELLAQRRWDLIVVHCSSVAPYVEHVRDVPKILDFCDMDSQKWLEFADYKPFPLSLGYRLEGRKMAAAERRLARRFDLSTVTTYAEWQTLRDFGAGAATDWFPMGVDAEYFCPDGEGYDADTISFIGRMDYYPNIECMVRFCAQTWPLLKARRPALKLLIVGADPTPEARRLGELPGVTVTGSVPDVRPFVRRSALMVAPLKIARGTQNKILEAMAMGVPVVTSSVAVGGVDAQAPAHLLVADTPEQTRDAILAVLERPEERERLSRAGRERVLSNHSWAQAMQRFDRMMESCIANFGAGRLAATQGQPG